MATAFEEVMAARGKGLPAEGEVSITGTDPVFSTRFRIGEVCAAVLGGVGVAVNDIWELRTGRRQKASIDVRHAAAALKSSSYLQRPDSAGVFRDVVNPEHEFMRSITQPWPTKDGRFVLTHFGLPNLKARMSKLLGLSEPTPETVAAAVAKWNALDLEQAIDENRVCGGMVRTNAEWLATPHGQVLAGKPIVEVIKIADSDPEPMPAGDRPLSGIRVLDLTRILAGPVCARTLAENGAEVLMVTAERLPQIPEHVIDTSHGKRSCFLDLSTAEGAARLKALVKDADVFSQGYRPGMIGKLGFGPEELAAIRPGIIYTTISCYGADGPFSHRGGWEQVAQTMTGICHDNNPARPHLLPAAACDYTDGLSRRVWRDAGAGAESPRGRQLSRPRFALPVGHVHPSPRQGGLSEREHGAGARGAGRDPDTKRAPAYRAAPASRTGTAAIRDAAGMDSSDAEARWGQGGVADRRWRQGGSRVDFERTFLTVAK